ncbi:hypothetical protein NQ318_013105 [Aromia moschata]|uniref:Shavenoid isoform B-like N-terminal domain-containing protein n=1 Tax=Aromia moschata TaxID=1265417 RepID=A0AAV8Y0I7_9CUCU|nr:hypothetical protein NQ318_013105 [Aromia moschata]
MLSTVVVLKIISDPHQPLHRSKLIPDRIFGKFGITLDIVDERRISSQSPQIVSYRECFAVSKTPPPFSVRSLVPELLSTDARRTSCINAFFVRKINLFGGDLGEPFTLRTILKLMGDFLNHKERDAARYLRHIVSLKPVVTFLIFPGSDVICTEETCVGMSSGTASAASGRDLCTCRCHPHLPALREDLRICVDDIHEVIEKDGFSCAQKRQFCDDTTPLVEKVISSQKIISCERAYLQSHPRASPVRTAEIIAAVAQSVRENPRTSTRHRAQQLNVTCTSLRRILHKDLGLFAYKLQLTQDVKENDHPLRYRFSVFTDKLYARAPYLEFMIHVSDTLSIFALSPATSEGTFKWHLAGRLQNSGISSTPLCRMS